MQLRGPLTETDCNTMSIIGICAYFFNMSSTMEGGRSAAEKAHAKCYLLLTHLVELLQRSAREIIDGRLYTAAAQDFLKLYHDLYGESTMTPKFHSVLHFGAFLQQWGSLPNCFVLERKHRLPKRSCIHACMHELGHVSIV